MGKRRKPRKANPLKQKRKGPPMAQVADRHELYEKAVQTADIEVGYLSRTFRELRGREMVSFKEDFAGTCNLACEWVSSAEGRTAMAVDLDPAVLAWGDERHVQQLDAEQRARLEVIEGNVLDTGGSELDAVCAFNFSYWYFKTREELRGYFAFVREQLVEDGVFFLDCFGGYEAQKEMREKRDIDGDFHYIWEQARFNPIDHHYTCHIHFRFKDGSKLDEAFTYEWRLWSIPEIRELLAEAGFSASKVYWQGWDDDEEEGTDEYEVVEEAEADPGWVCYIVALR